MNYSITQSLRKIFERVTLPMLLPRFPSDLKLITGITFWNSPRSMSKMQKTLLFMSLKHVNNYRFVYFYRFWYVTGMYHILIIFLYFIFIVIISNNRQTNVEWLINFVIFVDYRTSWNCIPIKFTDRKKLNTFYSLKYNILGISQTISNSCCKLAVWYSFIDTSLFLISDVSKILHWRWGPKILVCVLVQLFYRCINVKNQELDRYI